MPAPSGHDCKGHEGLKTCHIRTEGEIAVPDLQRCGARAFIPTHVEAFDDSLSLNSRTSASGFAGADKVQKEP